MVIVLKNNTPVEKLVDLFDCVKSLGLECDLRRKDGKYVINAIGDLPLNEVENVRLFDFVESVDCGCEPFKKVNRYENGDTIVDVGGRKFGGENFQIIAGPCSVESEKQVIEIARAVKKAGATLLRGGAFKPRTSPYAFQGLKETGIEYLLKAKEETGLPVVSEIMSVKHVDLFKDIDLLQIGARDMQNFELLKEVGKTGKPVLLKRGFANTIEEWLLSAEYLMSEGTSHIILCERGIRTFEKYTRYTLDISSVPILKKLTHLPVIVDPSHASGINYMVKPLSLASVGAGADGLMLEVHYSPSEAFSDGAQSIKPAELKEIVQTVNRMLPIAGKQV